MCDKFAQLSQNKSNKEKEREFFLYFFKKRLNNNNNNNDSENKKEEDDEETAENVTTELNQEELGEDDLTLTRDFEGISLDSETNTTSNFTDQEGVS